MGVRPDESRGRVGLDCSCLILRNVPSRVTGGGSGKTKRPVHPSLAKEWTGGREG